MAAARSFTELLFWQKARRWSADIFQFTKASEFATDHRLAVQINDSSESVMANIAEGFGRATQAQFIVFLGYSLREQPSLQFQLETMNRRFESTEYRVRSTGYSHLTAVRFRIGIAPLGASTMSSGWQPAATWPSSFK
jgi:four helix bundle protein